MSYSFEEAAASILQESTSLYGSASESLKFIVDAQLPKKLADYLNERGINCIHTLDLPDKNATTDSYIKQKAYEEGFILITKDDDFLRSFLIEKKPSKLVLIKTGNIANRELMDIFDKGLNVILSLMAKHSMIEITQKEIIVHS
ncbi:MAG: hypothetical protein JWQ38_2680 [Flavipsychrobacter sp.]|nr:hypothetical protein [Flavipsychrobacter sp.]